MLHRDNAPSHTAVSRNEVWPEKNIPLPLHLYSLDLGPYDFFHHSFEKLPQGNSFWDGQKHSNRFDRPAEGYFRVPAPLGGVK